MCRCHLHDSCRGCQHTFSRRRLLQGFGATAATAMGGLTALSGSAAGDSPGKVRVAAVFLADPDHREQWPYPNYDARGRQRQVLALLQKECPGIEFLPAAVKTAADIPKATALNDKVDGYLFYLVTLHTAVQVVDQVARFGKPMVVANEFLGGCSGFLGVCTNLAGRNVPAAMVSTTRMSDLVAVVQQFAGVRAPGTTPASFARQCEKVYRGTFPAPSAAACADDPASLTDIGECVKRFRESSFLIVGRGKAGQEQDFLGAKGRYLDFDELLAFYEKADRDEAAEWARRWNNRAQALGAGEYVEPSRPDPDAVQNSGAVYLATLDLLKKYGTDNVTMNCLGGFSSGTLPAYPCLGFMEILNDGGQGVCEAMPDDTISMMMARILSGRPGFVSDPTLDTSKNHIVYAHCVATTKVFGPQGPTNDFRIRTLHNRDPRGACVESMLPGGYMTTSFRTNVRRNQMVIHQAKAVGTLDSEHGCRTKLIGELCGDPLKTLKRWMQFGWHRVTVYGDLKEPLAELGRALGLEIVEEA